jgi:hypothetical protein
MTVRRVLGRVDECRPVLGMELGARCRSSTLVGDCALGAPERGLGALAVEKVRGGFVGCVTSLGESPGTPKDLQKEIEPFDEAATRIEVGRGGVPRQVAQDSINPER